MQKKPIGGAAAFQDPSRIQTFNLTPRDPKVIGIQRQSTAQSPSFTHSGRADHRPVHRARRGRRGWQTPRPAERDIPTSRTRLWERILCGMTEANPEPLIVKNEGPVGVLQLHRPKVLNASIRIDVQIGAAAEAFDEDPEIKCILILGSERAFAAGADIADMAPRSVADMKQRDQFRDWDRRAASARRWWLASVASPLAVDASWPCCAISPWPPTTPSSVNPKSASVSSRARGNAETGPKCGPSDGHGHVPHRTHA